MKTALWRLCLVLLVTTVRTNAQTDNETTTDTQALVDTVREACGGEIIDMHLHPSNYTTVDPLIQQMDQAGISKGILYAVYASNNTFLPDANTQVQDMIQESQGRMYGLASLNTSGDWNASRQEELDRLLTTHESPSFVGTKLAPPHTCLELNGTILVDIIQAVSTSSKPVVVIHTGTTPFCGVFGDIILGYRGCCQAQYVDPSFLEPLIAEYTNVTFILAHSGFDFLPPDDEYYYNGTLVENAIQVASMHSNVWLEISAMYPVEPDGRPRNPSGSAVVQAIKNAQLADRVLYGSDANFPGVMQVSLEWAVSAMVAAGFTQEEQCSALVDASRRIFGIPVGDDTKTSSHSNPLTLFVLMTTAAMTLWIL